VYTAVLKNLISIDANRFLFFFYKGPNFPFIRRSGTVHYILLFLKMFVPKLVWKCCLEFPVF